MDSYEGRDMASIVSEDSESRGKTDRVEAILSPMEVANTLRGTSPLSQNSFSFVMTVNMAKEAASAASPRSSKLANSRKRPL